MIYLTKFEDKLFFDPECTGPLLQTRPLKETRHKRDVTVQTDARVVMWVASASSTGFNFRRLSGEHGTSEKGESWRQARSASGV